MSTDSSTSPWAPLREPLRADRTAVVFMDLQGAIINLPATPHTVASVVQAATEVLAAARESSIQVFFVRAGTEPDGLDWPAPDSGVPHQARQFSAADREIMPELDRRSGDILITKRQWGAFYGTDLELQLRRRGIDTLVLSGISTNHVVESSARDAWERGFRLLFVEPAMSGMVPGMHQAAIEHTFPRIGHVLDTTTTCQLLRTAHL
ncbi:MAG TPA: isochorismatase family protein [Ilumatobacter sp.]|nr:isochorismatase family protein [Ilumatobacter sp.]